MFEGAGARRIAAAGEGGFGAAGLSAFAAPFFDFVEESLAGEAAIHGLGAGILDGDGNARGAVDERNGSGDLVNVLAAGSGGAGEGFRQIGLADAEALHAALDCVSGGLDGFAHGLAGWKLSCIKNSHEAERPSPL